MAATHFSGPVVSTNGFTGNITGDVTGNISGTVTATTLAATTSLAVGSSPATIKAIKSGTVSVTIAADAAAAEEDVSLTITGVAAGDVVLLMPLDASMETGVGTIACWVSATDTVKVRISNFNGSSLTGSTQNWTYLWFDLT
jgi:hypothetical protein